MLGLPSFIGSNAEEEYDPHKHRKIEKPTTYAETMTHMLKGSLGAGLLAMPNAIMRLGLAVGALSVIFIAAFATYCIQVLIHCQYELCKRNKRGYIEYPETMKIGVKGGPPCLRWTAGMFGQAVDVLLIIWQLGIGAIYFVFVAENVRQIIGYYGNEVPIRLMLIYVFPFLVLPSMVKDLKLLAPFSTVANACTFLGITLAFFYLVEDDVTIKPEMWDVKGFTEIPVFIGIVLFALEAPGVVLALEYRMDKPKQFVGLFGLFSVGMTILTGIYTALGVFGYLKYGNECQGSITLNLPQNEKKAQATKLIFAMAILLSYPLQNLVAWQILWRETKKKVKNPGIVFDYLFRFFIASIPFGLAMAAPTLGPFMGLIGALCLSMVAILFPAVLETSVWYPNKYGFCYYKVITDVFIVLFGLFCCFSGVYTSILEMSNEL